MNSQLRETVRLFLSSPGGLEEHRLVVRNIISELNSNPERTIQPVVEIIEWPSSIAASVSGYPQGAINEQTQNYDILLCILNHRIGTPTPRASSGTEEEFDRAFESRLIGEYKQILVFFANLPCPPNEIDPYQLALVNAFKQKLDRLGVVYQTYDDIGTLAKYVKTSVSYAINRMKPITCSADQDLYSNNDVNSHVEVFRTFDNRELSCRLFNPQWADYYMIPVAEFRKSRLVLRWTFATNSVYFRHGFKLTDCREPILSAGGVQTNGMNLLIHIGRNAIDLPWFVSPYRYGLRLAPDSPISDTLGLNSGNCELTIAPSGQTQFSIDNKVIHTELFPLDGIPQIYLMAWGDEHTFKCEVRDITLTAYLPKSGVAK